MSIDQIGTELKQQLGVCSNKQTNKQFNVMHFIHFFFQVSSKTKLKKKLFVSKHFNRETKTINKSNLS